MIIISFLLNILSFLHIGSTMLAISHQHNQLLFSTAEESEFYFEKGLYYTNNTKTVVVSTSLFLRNVIIPRTVIEIRTNPISRIGAFAECQDTLETVTFESPSMVRLIDEFTFEKCAKLTTIEIPASVERIGLYGFRECYGLKSVVFSENSNLTTLGWRCFEVCLSMEEIKFPPKCVNFETGAVISGCYSLKYVEYPADATSIIDYFAIDDISMVEFKIPENSKIEKIGQYAFYNCSSLTNINFPSNLQIIEEYAFSICYNLSVINLVNTNGYNFLQKDENGIIYQNNWKEIVMYPPGKKEFSSFSVPIGVTKICKTAFNSVNALEVIELSSNINIIEDNSFYDLNNLKEIKVNINNPTYKTSSEGILFLKDMKKLIFCPINCLNIEEYFVPNQVETIGKSSFSYNKNIERLRFDNANSKLSLIDERAFEHCLKLTSVILPSSCRTIEQYCFWYSYKLSNFVFNEGFSFLGVKVFMYCTSIKSIIIPKSLSFLSHFTFYNNSLTEIFIPNTVTSVGPSCFAFNYDLEKVVFEENSQVGSLLQETFQNCVKLTQIKLPSLLVSIDKYCFQNCHLLQLNETIGNENKDILPDSIQTISSYSFQNCYSIKYFNIPKSASSIQIRAFDGCKNLEYVYIPKEVRYIENSAFFICENMKKFVVDVESLYFVSDENGILYNKARTELWAYPAGKSETYFKVPENVLALKIVSFYGSRNLNFVNVTKNVREIGVQAFAQCTGLKCGGIIYACDKSLFKDAAVPNGALEPCPPTSVFTISIENNRNIYSRFNILYFIHFLISEF